MTLSADAVRAEVTRFWEAFNSKSLEALEDFYAHESSVFGSLGKRSEPGRLAAKRRQREYFGRDTIMRYQLNEVDVVLLSDTAAVASYTFQFHATGITGAGSRTEEHIQLGRATQVFAVDSSDGKLRIFHEHISLPGVG